MKSRLTLRWLERGECHEELIRTEDVSRGGARLVVRMPLAEGEIVYIEGREPGFQTRAEVRRVFLGGDGEPRLGIAFMDAEPSAPAPLEPARWCSERLLDKEAVDTGGTGTRASHSGGGVEIRAPVPP